MSSESENQKINFLAIASGWKNFIFPSKTMEELAKTRAEICSTCPSFVKEHKFKKWLPEDNTTTEITGAGCEHCSCYLPAKVRQVLENCPEKKW